MSGMTIRPRTVTTACPYWTTSHPYADAAHARSVMGSNDFTYEPLPEDKNLIRLLSILPGVDDDAVDCALTAHSVERAPTYYAISYTWGNPSNSKDIIIDGHRMLVHETCYYVSWQDRHLGRSQYYRIDAICIAQGNITEKNEQVRLMGVIFGNAARAFTRIGPYANDSEFAMRMLESCDASVQAP